MKTDNIVGSRELDGEDGEIFAGRYRLLRLISTGTGGEVFLAENLATRICCALKILPTGFAPEALRQLQVEFSRLTDLAHPNIVRVYEAGIAVRGGKDSHAFLVLDYVAGPTLVEAVEAVPEAGRLECFALATEALADALAYLHDHGFLHGDISPANIRCTKDGKPMLLDFGLSEGRQAETACASQTVSGTLGFLAPEALLGERGPGGDLFALGATLYAAWTGSAPFGVGVEAIRRTLCGLPSPPSELRAGLTAAWDKLILGLLNPAPELRPSSARELLRAIRRELPDRPVHMEEDLAVPYPGGDPLAGLVVGRTHEASALRGYLEGLAEGCASVSVVAVVGPLASGRGTLIRKVLREVRLSVLSQTLPPFDVEERGCADLLLALRKKVPCLKAEAWQEPTGGSRAQLAELVGALEERSQSRPLCLVLPGTPEDAALAEAIAGNPPSGRLMALVRGERIQEREGLVAIPIRPLSSQAIAELAKGGSGIAPSSAVLGEIVETSAGLAGRVELLVRRWIANVRDGRPEIVLGAERDLDLDGLLDTSLRTMSVDARTFVLAATLAIPTGHQFELAGLPETRLGSAEAEARSAGWIAATSRNVPSDRHAAAVWRALAGDGHLRKVAREFLSALPEEDLRRPEILCAFGESTEAASEFWRGMRDANGRGAWGQVAYLGGRARELSPSSGTHEDRLCMAGVLGILGRYDEGLAVLDECGEDFGAGVAARFADRKAWLLGRRGDPELACRILTEALGGLEPGEEDALLLRARWSRMLVSCGKYADAFAAAEPAIHSKSRAGVAARESATLALAYAGDLEKAQSLLETLHVDVLSIRDASVLARVEALDGLVHQIGGRPLQAAQSYERAQNQCEALRDLHGAAVARFNRGCALAETGNYAGALEAFSLAIRDLGRLGATTDHALAVFNAGQLFLQLGEVESALRAVRRLEDDARSARMETFQAYALVLHADLLRRQGENKQAIQAFVSAGRACTRLGMQVMAVLASLGQAESLAAEGDLSSANLIVRRVETAEKASLPWHDAADLPNAESVVITRARLVLAGGSLGAAADVALAVELTGHALHARQMGRRPVAWRLASLAAQVFGRTRDPRRDAQFSLAQTAFQEVKMNTPAKYWPGLESDPDFSALSPHKAGARGTNSGNGERSSLLDGRLRRLLRVNKRLNSDLRLSRVLETIIDAVIELTDAERGFLLLKDADGELSVKVARNIDQTSLEGPGFALSRSIAKKAATNGEPVITVDAAGDSRFSELLSVSDLHLRSVLAVPLSVKGSVVGTIYVDHRLRKGVFGDDEVAMVMDFAEQGAIAIENARLVSELRRREQQVQSLNRRLERELRSQEAELTNVRVELKESRESAALRYDYRQIVGQSPGMLDLFRLLDRVTDTALSVVIEGESGTGKELVARAIHFHGPRKARAFVSENCAAIPETLLESTLFGHVRGAFTGADREKRGLFAIADGGTLFLDEVAEMSAAMQGKLLRVLQEGEFHRVGSERPEKADVRVLVATNKNLAELVEAGTFRKDLFYRLSVVRIHLPALRERREDIPLLVQHFLRKAATATGVASKRVDPSAMAKLCTYSWPGNVRELENEVARAGAFAGETILSGDLSPFIGAPRDLADAPTGDSGELKLRPRVERLERALIREAMNKAAGNQTKASLALGLSRFGLQKKLRRYNLAL